MDPMDPYRAIDSPPLLLHHHPSSSPERGGLDFGGWKPILANTGPHQEEEILPFRRSAVPSLRPSGALVRLAVTSGPCKQPASSPFLVLPSPGLFSILWSGGLTLFVLPGVRPLDSVYDMYVRLGEREGAAIASLAR